MRFAIYLTTAAVAGFIATAAQAYDDCSVRGRYCGYPAWAQNAFEGPTGRRPEAAVRAIDRARAYRQSTDRYRYRRR